MKELINSVVSSVEINRDKTLIKFNTDKGSFTYYTYGDCCSNSWMEHVSGLNELIGHEVISTSEVDLDRVLELDEYGYTDNCLEIYNSIACTAKGRFVIEYRNESNGYYGGSLDLVDPNDKWSMFDSRDEDVTFTTLKEDF